VFVPATVPDVTGKTIPTAVTRIHEANLEVGDIVPIAGTPGRVVRTDPTPGEAVTAGTHVTIYIGALGA
jgi:beta-lactam-binding protein with PASTA domain